MWQFSWTNGTTITKILDYGPRDINYLIVDGAVRPKYINSEVKMDGTQATRFVHKPYYPSYYLYWPIVTDIAPKHGGTESLFKTLSELPLYRTLVMKDGVENLSFNIQVINRTIVNLKTVGDNEVLRSVRLEFIFLTTTGV